ncbi:hypothetical protein D3C75_641590 [compost metagenome]
MVLAVITFIGAVIHIADAVIPGDLHITLLRCSIYQTDVRGFDFQLGPVNAWSNMDGNPFLLALGIHSGSGSKGILYRRVVVRFGGIPYI